MVVTDAMWQAVPSEARLFNREQRMRYQQLMILVTLATFAAVSTLVAAGLTLFWPRLSASLSQLSAVTRARLLVALRLAPVAVAVLACVVTLLAFLRHEPRATVETPGGILIAGAAAGIGLAVMGLWRLIVRCRATSRFRPGGGAHGHARHRAWRLAASMASGRGLPTGGTGRHLAAPRPDRPIASSNRFRTTSCR